MLTDTHAHLYWEDFKDDFDHVIQHALDNGITTIINIGVDTEKSIEATQLKNDKIKFYSTIGIHPHEAHKYIENSSHTIAEEIQKLEEIYHNNPSKIVAIGEAGLDYYFGENPDYIPTNISTDQLKQLQKDLFQSQIDLAKKLNLPIVVHCRDDRSENPENIEAWDDCLQMLQNSYGILHCYSGTQEITQKALNMNFLISFAGNITYKKNEYLREAIKIIPLEKIVLETDCPFLSPQSSRGKRNEPANIKEIAECIAQVKEISLEEVAVQTTQNAKQILKIA